MRILVVDDESTARKTMKYVMKEFGECVAVESGDKAIKLFQQAWADWRPFQLIMMDIELGDQSGLNIMKTIRAMEQEKNIPPEEGVRIIMVSIHSSKDIVLDSFKAGCNEFVVKPVDKKTMSEKLRKLGGVFDVAG